MKSLKITLLLAVFCLALVGLTNVNEANVTDIEKAKSFDIESSEYQITSTGKTKKQKPPQA